MEQAISGRRCPGIDLVDRHLSLQQEVLQGLALAAPGGQQGVTDLPQVGLLRVLQALAGRDLLVHQVRPELVRGGVQIEVHPGPGGQGVEHLHQERG